RVLEEVAQEQSALRSSLSPALQDEHDALQARRAELMMRRQAASDVRHTDDIQALAHEVERRAGELRRSSAAFRVRSEPPTIEAVQAALPGDAMLVEFVRYWPFDPADRGRRWAEPRYLAYLLACEGPPQWAPLGA